MNAKGADMWVSCWPLSTTPQVGTGWHIRTTLPPGRRQELRGGGAMTGCVVVPHPSIPLPLTKITGNDDEQVVAIAVPLHQPSPPSPRVSAHSPARSRFLPPLVTSCSDLQL